MKFLKRKSGTGRDDEFPQYVEPAQRQPAPVSKRQPSPSTPSINSGFSAGPTPPPKELAPPPLYARYARMTSTTSFDSIGGNNLGNLGGLDSPSGSRFSAYNGSTASGFGASLHSTTASAESGGHNVASYGRATGSALFSGGNAIGSKAALAAAAPKEAAKPEPIKLKQRRVRKFDDDAPKVVSTTDNAKSSGATPLSRPTTGSSQANGWSDITTPKASIDGSIGGTNGIYSKSSAFPNGTSSTRTTVNKQLPNGLGTPSNSTLPGSSGTAATISSTPNGDSTRAAPTSQPLQQSVLQPEDDVFSFYNAAVRMSENPQPIARSPSPARPKEGPPIALLNRAQKSSSSLTPSSEAPSRSLPTPSQTQDEIVVKPPSRRESLQHAAKAALDSVKPPVVPTPPVQRAPSPAKTRTVVPADPRVSDTPMEKPKRQSTLPTPSTVANPPAEVSMAGVGAGSRHSMQLNQPKPRPASTQAVPAVAFPTAATYQTARSSSPITQSRITASPVSFTPSPEVPAPMRETPRAATPERKYPTSIADKTPLIRNTSPAKAVTPSSLLASNTSMPKASSLPIPSSAASSVSTVRQSRMHATFPTPEAPVPVKEEPTREQPSARSAVSARSHIPIPEAKPISYPRGVPLSDNSLTPSRQNSSNSVASSSAPSATRSASAITTPSGLETPDEMSMSPIMRSPEPVKEVSKITLTKRGSRINGVTYSRDSDITPPATASPVQTVQRKQRAQEPVAALEQIQTVTTSRVKEEIARREREEVKNAPLSPAQEEKEKFRRRLTRDGTNDFLDNEHPPAQSLPDPPYTIAPTPASRQMNGHAREESSPPEPVGLSFTERSTTPVSRGQAQYSHQNRRERYIPTPEPEPEFDLIYPIEEHLAHPELLAPLLEFLQFSDLLALTTVSKIIRNLLEDRRELREEVLERFLGTVGYMRWDFAKKREPLALTLRDLNSYLRGVSIPIHRYAEIAEGQTFNAKEGKSRIVRLLASSTRAYSKVVLRLRLQAEMETLAAQQPEEALPDRSRPQSPLVRAQSPPTTGGTWKKMFHSPLYRIGHAPLLRVFVPSPDGPWLSDISVLACEKELKRAGITQLLKIGDVIWDTAVSDEAGFGNVGRLVWDGNYLIDLDYTFSTTGDIPPYLHSLAFPPAYFHKVLRSSGNPIMQMDLRPWGREIASNLQLVQDRVQAETPQGGRHTVMRWTHRTRFQVIRGIPIPDSNLSVDAGWEGTIVLEAEGTNEGLADLQLRCGMEWFKPQPGVQPKQGDGGRVLRLIRERSRPGEIWLRTVRMKERIS